MTSRKKILISAGVLFGGTLLTLLVLPFLFKDRIVERARAELDRAVDADITWSSAGLGFFRDFPNLTLRLQELSVVGTDRFTGDTLASVGSFRLVLDLGSVVQGLRQRGPFVVRSIELDEPALRLSILEDGVSSWDIVRSATDGAEVEEPESPDSGSGSGREVGVELRDFEITNGRIVFENAGSGLFVSLEGLQHSLSGNFSRESLVMSTSTHADRTTLRFAGAPYLSGVTLDFDADVDVDLARKRFAFLDNELRLNDLLLRFSGEVTQPAEDLVLDVTFEAPETEFGQMLSLVPVLYARDFASLETSGTFSVSGSVRGAYGEEAFPAFTLDATVDGGTFRYPDLPLPARAISADLSIDNPGGDVDSTVVDLSRFHVEIGDQPLDASLSLRTPVSDPDFDAEVRGTLDLAALARTVKLENVDELGGVVTADATVRARMSDVDSARYERIAAQGTVSARGLTLTSADLRQPVAVEEMTMELSPERVDLQSFRAQLGSSDIDATGQLDNLLGFMLRDEPLRGAGTFASRYFVLDEWRSDDAELSAIPVPAMLDLTLDGTVDRLTYGALEMTNARGSLTMRDQRLTLDGFSLETLGGRIGVNGHYETLDPAQPTFGVDLTLDSLDIAGAAQAFLTVRTLAPVARYARGTFSADLDLTGAMDQEMTPLFDVLDGAGSLLTSRIAIEGFPLLDRLSQALRVSRLSNPTFDALRSSVRIEDGRLHVEPFEIGVAGLRLGVDGSSGIDQSLDYTLALAMPRGSLAEAAEGVVQGLASRVGANLAGADSVRVGVQVGGTISDPSIDLGLGETVASVREAAGQAAEAAVERQVDEARERLEAAEEEARRQAAARADSLVAEAEERADVVRAEARELADGIRAEADRQAEEVLARATNPLARRAAEPIVERIRQEAAERADQMVREADERADALVAEARRRAGQDPGAGRADDPGGIDGP